MGVTRDLMELTQQAVKDAGDGIEITGETLLVQRLKKRAIKTKSGLELSTSARRQVTSFESNQPEFVKVLAVGEGYYDDETDKAVPLDIQPGEIIEVGKHSVNWFSAFGAIIDNAEDGVGVGLTLAPSRRLKFKNEEAFNKFMDHFFDPELIA